MPNDYADTIIRSAMDNLDNDTASQKLIKAIPFLAEWQAIREAVVRNLT